MPLSAVVFSASAEEYEARLAAARAKVEARLAAQRSAESRAYALLMACLAPQQKRCMTRYDHIIVRTPAGRRYRLLWGTMGNVECINERGDPTARYCAHPMGQPIGDVVLTQKLWLEGGLEHEFLAVANCHWSRPMSPTRRRLAQRAARRRWGWRWCVWCLDEHRSGHEHFAGVEHHQGFDVVPVFAR